MNRRRKACGLGLTIAISASLSLVPWSPSPAQAQDGCDVRDGKASRGSTINRRPKRFQFEGSPYVGARFDSCKGNVRVYFGEPSRGGDGIRYRINYGQRRESTRPVFSHTWESKDGESGRFTRAFPTRELGPANVFAFFRVQRCQSQPLSRSKCTRWSPTVTVSLGSNELTEY